MSSVLVAFSCILVIKCQMYKAQSLSQAPFHVAVWKRGWGVCSPYKNEIRMGFDPTVYI